MHDYPNGVLIFCSEQVAEAVHPLRPLRRRVYSCGRRFETSVLHDMIEAERAPPYGVICIDGGDAVFGSARFVGAALEGGQGCDVTQLRRVRAEIHGRTCKGGQSQNRYQRLRDEAELAFLRKVAECAESLFASARGLVLAGPAEMKRKLEPELCHSLRQRVIGVIDLSCAVGPQALWHAANGARMAAAKEESRGVEEALARFMELTSRPDATTGGTLACYGELDTLAALTMGAVDCLLIPANWKGARLTAEDCQALAQMHGAQIIEVEPRSEHAAQFCQGFGIGACLRWPIEPDELLEEDTLSPAFGRKNDATAHVGSPLEAAPDQNLETDIAPCAAERSDLIGWVEEAVCQAIEDASAATALAACVDVLLPQDLTTSADTTSSAAGYDAEAYIQDVTTEIGDLLMQEAIPQALAEEVARRCRTFLGSQLRQEQ